MPQTLAEKVWERHIVRRHEGEPDLLYVDLHLVHEVTSPQAFDALRCTAEPSAARTSRSRRWITTSRPRRSGHRRGERSPDAGAPTQHRRFRHHRVPVGSAGSRHRARDRPRDGLHATRHDDRLRRLAYVDARGVRRTGAGDRHVGGRACPGDADLAAGEAEVDGGDGGRRASDRLQREGHHPRDHQHDRHRRGHRPRDRVPGLRDPRALDGGQDDGLQHVDRRRSACGDGRARRHHLRVRRRQAARAEGRRLGTGGRPLAFARDRRRSGLRH